MRRFNHPLDDVRIASPCKADWEQMYGDDRRRYCAECKLNVYNLSGLTRKEAENLIIQSEDRLCVRFYRRIDGTVLTNDCPVGWQRIKRRSKRALSAIASFIVGILSGVISLRMAEVALNLLPIGDVPAVRSNSPLNNKVDDVLVDDSENREPMVGQVVIPVRSSAGPAVSRIESIRKLIIEK